jgi:hypothetical protein
MIDVDAETDLTLTLTVGWWDANPKARSSKSVLCTPRNRTQKCECKCQYFAICELPLVFTPLILYFYYVTRCALCRLLQALKLLCL